MDDRWSIEQVMAVAPSPSAFAAAQPLADLHRWSGTGADGRAAWGRCRGSGREPYDTMVDHIGVRWRCSCPSRRSPCKHALALLILWARGDVADASPPKAVAGWATKESPGSSSGAGAAASAGAGAAAGGGTGAEPAAGPGTETPHESSNDAPSSTDPPPDTDRARDDRVARMREGLVELDRWLDDRLRTGLSDPSLARYATWDLLAARLVDARAGALANRVRRLAGMVGASADWHDRVLSELGILHLLAQAGLRLPDLPGGLADAVATASGWQVRQADVLAGVPETDDWVVAGRSDTREDRIEVRRTWLWGSVGRRWAMVLSFAAYGQSLDTGPAEGLEVGTSVHADVFRYPGGSLRALVGRRDGDPKGPVAPAAVDVAAGCDAVGRAVAREPWLERMAVTVLAAPAVAGGRWVLTDHTGSLALIGERRALSSLLAASMGDVVPVTVEWTPHGVVPLAVHLADRTLDVGRMADASFVRAS